MNFLNPTQIQDWHAHVYFDASSRDAAWALREAATLAFAPRVDIGRFHERPVGPHPMWSFQLRIGLEDFAEVVGWLALNHGALDVFLHPNTGDALTDHRDRALWIGRPHVLALAGFGA